MTGPLWHFHIERESTESVLILSISGRAGMAAADGRDGAFVICGVRQPVEIAMELAGVFGHLAVEPTRSEAVARAKRAPHSR